MGYYPTTTEGLKKLPADLAGVNVNHLTGIAPIHIDETPDVLNFKILPIDIKQGVGGNTAHCAIARAVKRELAIPMDNAGVYVSGQIIVYGEDGVRTYEIPAGASNFISKFDEWKRMGGERPRPFLLKARTLHTVTSQIAAWAKRTKKSAMTAVVGSPFKKPAQVDLATGAAAVSAMEYAE
jgi:hypothetical protein